MGLWISSIIIEWEANDPFDDLREAVDNLQPTVPLEQEVPVLERQDATVSRDGREAYYEAVFDAY